MISIDDVDDISLDARHYEEMKMVKVKMLARQHGYCENDLRNPERLKN